MSLLKSARGAIDRKDYEEGLRFSQETLFGDPESYNGHIFSGVCLENLNRLEEAIQSYSKAIAINGSKLLSYQGLSSVYEKRLTQNPTSVEDKKALADLKVTLSTKQRESNDIKNVLSSLDRAIELFTELQNYSQALALHQERLTLDPSTQNAIMTIKFIHKNLSNETTVILNVLLPLLDDLLTKDDTPPLEILKIYLTHKISDPITAHKAINRFPNEPFGYEHLFNAFVRSVALVNEEAPLTIENEMISAYEVLCPGSKLLVSMKAAKQLSEGNFVAAMDILRGKKDMNIHSQLLMSKCYLGLRDYLGALKSLPTQERVMDADVKDSLTYIRIKTLYLSYRIEEIQEQQLSEPIPKDLRDIWTNILAFRGTLADTPNSKLAPGIVAYAQKRESEAVSHLEPHLSTHFEAGLILGTIYYKTKELDKARICFLKSASLNPGVSHPYKYLGHIYASNAMTSRALKCFLKSLKLNPGDENLMRSISVTLEDSGDVIEHREFLYGITVRSINLSEEIREWAFCRLGILDLNCGKAFTAAANLQQVYQKSATGIHLNALEALGDAYIMRKSFNSALKIFEEASSKGSSYANLRLAHTTYLLGNSSEAIALYEAITPASKTSTEALLRNKGLAQAHLFLAKEELFEVIDPLGVSHASKSLEYALRAAASHPNLATLWKLCVDAILVLEDVSEEMLVDHFVVPLELETENTPPSKAFLRKVGLHLALQGIKANPGEDSLWHDLGLLQLSLARGDEQKGSSSTALRSLKHAVSLRPNCPLYWNSLGFAAHTLHQYELAQHAFIKAVNLDGIFSAAWTNLGVFYLGLGMDFLANRALTEGQSGSPVYSPAWSGQSVLARKVGSLDTMDVLRHAALMGMEVFACYQYGNMICGILKDQNRGAKVNTHDTYVMDKLHGLPTATDSIQKFLRRHPTSSHAWGVYSTLLEAQGHHTSALQALQREIDLKPTPIAYLRLARILHKVHDFNGSIQALHDSELTSSDPNASALLSLNLLRSSQVQKAYANYQETLRLIHPDNHTAKADVLSALSSIALSVQGPPAALSLLQQASKLSNRPFFSLAILGIQTRNVELILESLRKLDPKDPHSLILQCLVMAYYQKNPSKAITSLVKALHVNPEVIDHWRTLSQLAVTFGPPAQSRANLSVDSKESKDHLLRTVSEMKAPSDDGGRRVRIASKLVHSFPYLAQGRCLLLQALQINDRKKDAKEIGVTANLLLSQKDPLSRWFNGIVCS